MQFTAREDIAAPIDSVFALVSDFEQFERAVLRRGIEISRIDDLQHPGPGMAWNSRFSFRGKPREMRAELVQIHQPETLRIKAESSGMNGTVTVDLVQLSPRQTRMQVVTELKARTLSARLLLQSMKLARAAMTGRYRDGIAQFARGIEGRLGAPRRRA